MDCWRQWIRHRTASVNEYSTRYSEAIDAAHRTEHWRLQTTSNRQGSSGLSKRIGRQRTGTILDELASFTVTFVIGREINAHFKLLLFKVNKFFYGHRYIFFCYGGSSFKCQ
jgi:thymidylate synthase ThyX